MYRSTRNTSVEVSFKEALLQGLAPDGGLFIPTEIPALPSSWQTAPNFIELGFSVLHQWLKDEVEDTALHDLVADALSFEAPLVALPPSKGLGENVFVLELFHGPTLSFKDFGARTMARLMGYFLKTSHQKTTILVATSGDTGSAVADGFAGQPNIEVVLLYPKGQVSEVQERQLIVARNGVKAFAIEGTFDDCQRMVKEAFVSKELAQQNLSSANSINIGRLLPQQLYYIWAVRQLNVATTFCTPSGNLGNLTGGIFASISGLPVHQFIAAHNANSFFPTFLKTHEKAYQPSKRTLSNAMDVGVPSNFERLETLLPPDQLERQIVGYTTTDKETLETIKTVYHETGYVACPHTAVGLHAVMQYRKTHQNTQNHPIVVLSTAHPAKFPQVINTAIPSLHPKAPRLEALKDKPTSVETLAPTLDALKAVLL